MQKNRLITLSLRKIKVSFKRFFSLITLSLLGLSFFIGMKISTPNLLISLDKYYKDNNVYDVEILSTNGLNEEDIKELSKIDSNIEVHGLHFKDILFNDKNVNSEVIRIKEMDPTINKIVLLDGRLPNKKNEIVIDEKYLLTKDAKIGDELELIAEENDKDLNVNRVKIVGIINSPIFLATNEGSLNRGNTLIGNGEIKYYAYALNSIFNMDYYTEIYIDNKKTDAYITNSNIYNKKNDKLIKKIDSIKDKRIKFRYEELKNIALAKINDEEEKVNKEITNSKERLKSVKTEIDNATRQLDIKKKQLNYASYQLRIKENEISTATQVIEKTENELRQKKQELDNAKNSIENYDNLLTVAKKNKNSTLTKDDIISILPNDSEKESTIQKIELATNFGANLSNLTVIKEQIISSKVDPNGTTIAKNNQLEQTLEGVLTIENGYSIYNSKTIELNNYKNNLTQAKTTYNNYLAEYNNASTMYTGAISEYNKKLGIYNEATKEITEKENTAKQEFAKAREKISETITPGTWMIRNRLDNVDYTGFIDSIESLKNLSSIFPIIFFLVSIFISLLSMTRMGIEDRNEMGTLKAFGFSKREILLQYIIYSLLATIIGSILGILLGIGFFPKMIFNVYRNLYAIPKLIYADFTDIVIIGTIIVIVCIVGSTIVSIINILRENTISLLRPIAPLIGKKVLLEKIPFLWNKMTFESKITTRNILRYKKRILMTLTGITSCTMILMASFLIRDSITTVLDVQFKEIFTYDSIIYLDGSKLSYELDEVFNKEHIKKSLYADLERVKVKNTTANLLVPNDDTELKNVITLRNNKGELTISHDGVIITSKLAKLYKVKPNDYIKMKTTDNREFSLKVTNITENYIDNYIYMNKDTYEEMIGLYKLNTAYLRLDNKENEKAVVEDLLHNNQNILSYLSINSNIASVQNMFTSLDKVVLIAVIFSLLLSIVVLYSLAYIVISERQREIATLKVLGFDDEEVDIYLLKEQAIIIATGILLGLIIGIFYALALVDTLEIRMVQFNKDLLFRNYIVSLLLMIAFSIIVGQLIHFRLRKINMIESLKSIE
ncbi:MAG: FtsX-like permease family protein [Bacilli bacterium]|nr:FtsX-like permease family protein [Bacilli bacterium]